MYLLCKRFLLHYTRFTRLGVAQALFAMRLRRAEQHGRDLHVRLLVLSDGAPIELGGKYLARRVAHDNALVGTRRMRA